MTWQPIETFNGRDGEKVDLWLNIPASAGSFGWADSFRVPDACRSRGGWFHYEGIIEKQIKPEYVTHWMPLPDPPSAGVTISNPASSSDEALNQ